jgi:hypothetical protein
MPSWHAQGRPFLFFTYRSIFTGYCNMVALFGFVLGPYIYLKFCSCVVLYKFTNQKKISILPLFNWQISITAISTSASWFRLFSSSSSWFSRSVRKAQLNCNVDFYSSLVLLRGDNVQNIAPFVSVVDKPNVGHSEPISCEEFRDHCWEKNVWNWLITDIRLWNSYIL